MDKHTGMGEHRSTGTRKEKKIETRRITSDGPSVHDPLSVVNRNRATRFERLDFVQLSQSETSA